MKNSTRSILVIVVCVLCGFTIFASFVLTAFNKIQNDPITALVSQYVYSNTEFKEKYGEVTAVNHMVFKKEEKTDRYMKVAYSVETERTSNYFVYLTIEKQNEQWVVTGMEVIEKLRNSDK